MRGGAKFKYLLTHNPGELSRGFFSVNERKEVVKEKLMARALELASRGMGYTSPNPMVGALVVKNGEVVGEGFHRRAGAPHAEIYALREAGERARGGDLYVNLEPCSHYGRTPPCTEAIIKAGIARVIIAMKDPNPKVAGTGIKRLREAGLKVEVGIKEKEALCLNEVYIKYITGGMPFVILKTAMTLDGKIATARGDSRWVTGPDARREVHRLRHIYDAVLVGSGTVIADDPQLTCRLNEKEVNDPVRIIADSRLRITTEARVFNLNSKAPTIVATSAGCDRNKKKMLEDKGAIVLEVETSNSRLNLRKLMSLLAERKICSILTEAGPTLNASLFKEGLVDKILIFVAPKLLGGVCSPGPIGGEAPARMKEALLLKGVEVRRIGGDYLFSGYLK